MHRRLALDTRGERLAERCQPLAGREVPVSNLLAVGRHNRPAAGRVGVRRLRRPGQRREVPRMPPGNHSQTNSTRYIPCKCKGYGYDNPRRAGRVGPVRWACGRRGRAWPFMNGQRWIAHSRAQSHRSRRETGRPPGDLAAMGQGRYEFVRQSVRARSTRRGRHACPQADVLGQQKMGCQKTERDLNERS